jgi:membrane associated rhomboid family serine protease
MVASSSWQWPFIKLVSLVILLPFIISYLHLKDFAYRRNEYCFVGRGAAASAFFPPSLFFRESEVVNNKDNQRLRGDSAISNDDEDHIAIDSGLFGIYAPTIISAAGLRQKQKRQKQKYQQNQQLYINQRQFRLQQSSLFRYNVIGGGWPSITQLSAAISSLPPSSASTSSTQLESSSNQYVIALVDETGGGKRWCLQPSAASTTTVSSLSSLAAFPEVTRFCSDPLTLHPNDDGSNTVYIYPPSGKWKKTIGSSNTQTPTLSSSSLTTTTSSASHIVVSCPSPPTISYPDADHTSKKQHVRWQQQNERQNQNVQFLLNQPATSLLLLLNIGLAFHYWNQRISPNSVCKRYKNIVHDHEWWRGLSGATAHFEPLHIGFNAMSLQSLGRELEGERGLYGSIPFLVYNIALIVCTTMVMMGMVHARLRYIQWKLDDSSSNNDNNNNNNASNPRTHYQELHDRLRETSTVGYSAVLFAWMVVSTMERTQPTCPIPFFSDVCFETHTVPGVPSLRYNISPIASLFVAQFIMPRASFMG